MDEILKKEDEIYCPECAKPIKRDAVICVNCGVQIKEIKTSGTTTYNLNAKSKGIAIVFSIFLGFWSWLYTYKKDFKKFWIFLGLPIVFMGIVIIIETLNSVSNPLNKYTSSFMLVHSHLYVGFYSALAKYGTWIWLLFFIPHICALCNSIIRPENFYKNYPNGNNNKA
ncbi:MAG: zinc ribbon domain-containing protein [Actinobacteria bacterium]|nr:zinc ribbon domain-containing protein [Actinomycetota bacterium]